MLPDRVIAYQSSNKVLIYGKMSIFLCKDASDHHSYSTLFDQHSMNYRTVQVDFQPSSFYFYPILTTWFQMP